MSESSWNAVVVDDHRAVRDMTRRLLEAAGHDVLGEASSGAEGLEKVRELDPDVVMLDIVLPDISGLDVSRALRDEGSNTAVVLISSYELDDLGDSIHEVGADAFLSKSALSVESIQALDLWPRASTQS